MSVGATTPLSAEEILAIARERNKINVVDADKTGFNGMTSETFMKLLITQLQNQDPTEPFDNEAMLNQISQMRTLSANLELESTLKNISLGQQLTNAAAFLGKEVTAKVDNKDVTGVVQRVSVQDGKTQLDLGSGTIIPADTVLTVGEA